MTANAKNLSSLANALDDGTSGQFLQSTGSGGVAFADVAAGATVYDSAELLPLSGNSAGDMAYVTGTNRFYINNGSGWYSISLVNTNPNITSVQDASAGTTPFILATDGSATVITVTANDPEQIPLTFGYSVTAGSLTNGGGTTATVTQVDNVFTVTPTTTEAYRGDFTLTFTASDGVNTATSANLFSLAFAILNSRYTTLLATATSTGDNNDITDSSTNNHTITVNGDAHAGTFSPYRRGGYSTYFDGSGDWLELTGTALGNGDFTVEAWVWLDSLKDYNVIYDDRATGSSATGLALGVTSTGAPYLYTNNGFQITSSQTCTANTWHHISLVRSSGVITIYLDGTSGGTYSSSANFTDTNLGIGVARTYTVTSQFGGYIRDVRAVVGSAITPASGGPTIPLTAVTNTKLLTCHLPYFKDGSSNAHAITVNGNTSTKPFGPYDYRQYSATNNGGSVYFDGSGDVIYTPQDTAFNFGTGDFTFEAWVYPTLYTSNNWNTLFAIGNSTNFGGLLVGKTDTGSFVIRQYGAANVVTTTNLPDLNAWTHIACVRSSGTSKLYYNGLEIATASDTTNYSSTTPFAHIGNSDHTSYSHYWNGYVSDARFISGTAVYSGAFTPPSGPLTTTGGTYPSTTNVNTSITSGHTKLLIKGTDASIIDKSQGGNLELHGNTTGSTTQVKFADTKSMYFDGNDGITANGIRIPTTQYTHWTLEAWVYATTSDANTERQVFSQYDGDTFGNRFLFGHAGGAYRLFNGGSSVTSGSGVIQFNTWQHIAATYNGSTASADFGKYTLWVDGVSQGSMTLSRGANNSDLQIGSRNQGSTNPWLGYIQDARLTVGLLRYTANFTPPTEPLKG